MTTQDSNTNNAPAQNIVNQVIVTGNVAFTPEMKYLPSGTAIVKTKLYVTRRWNDKTEKNPDGTPVKKEKTVEVKIVAWGAKAEAMNDAIGKGDLIEIVGELEAPEAYLSTKEVNEDGTPKLMAINVITVREGRVIFSKRQEGQAPSDDQPAPSAPKTDPVVDGSKWEDFGDIPF